MIELILVLIMTLIISAFFSHIAGMSFLTALSASVIGILLSRPVIMFINWWRNGRGVTEANDPRRE